MAMQLHNTFTKSVITVERPLRPYLRQSQWLGLLSNYNYAAYDDLYISKVEKRLGLSYV